MSRRLSYYFNNGGSDDPNQEQNNETKNTNKNSLKRIKPGSWVITGNNIISDNKPDIKDPDNLEDEFFVKKFDSDEDEKNYSNISENDTESKEDVKNKKPKLMEGIMNLFQFNSNVDESKSDNNESKSNETSINGGSSSDVFDLEEIEDLSKLKDTSDFEKYEYPIYDDSKHPTYTTYNSNEYQPSTNIDKTDLLKKIDNIIENISKYQNNLYKTGGTTNRVQVSKKRKNEFIIPQKDEEYAATYEDDFEYTENEKFNNEYNPNIEQNDLLELDLLNQWVYEDDNSEVYNTDLLNTHKELVETIGEKNTEELIDFLSESGENFEINESTLEDEEEDNEETLDDLRLKAKEKNKQHRYVLRKRKK